MCASQATSSRGQGSHTQSKRKPLRAPNSHSCRLLIQCLQFLGPVVLAGILFVDTLNNNTICCYIH